MTAKGPGKHVFVPETSSETNETLVQEPDVAQGQPRRYSDKDVSAALDAAVGSAAYVKFVTIERSKLIFRHAYNRQLGDDEIAATLKTICDGVVAAAETDPAVKQAYYETDGVALQDCN